MKTAVIVLLMVGSCLGATTVEMLVSNKNFSTLVSLVTKAQLVSTLNGGNFTIFAPTNAAFAKLDSKTLDAVSNDTALLTDVLTYHAIDSLVMSSAARNELVVNTVRGLGARFNIYQNKMGTTVTIQGCKISQFDTVASNGVIHVIDSVMMAPTGNIVDIGNSSASHKTLIALVNQAGIGSALLKQGLTLFAPTDDAFKKVDPATLQAVQNDVKLLTSVLTYHVVDSTQWAAGLYNNETVPTLNGKNITITTTNGVMVNNANVTAADIGATNGVVHVIDAVLIPPADSAAVGKR